MTPRTPLPPGPYGDPDNTMTAAELRVELACADRTIEALNARVEVLEAALRPRCSTSRLPNRSHPQ